MKTNSCAPKTELLIISLVLVCVVTHISAISVSSYDKGYTLYSPAASVENFYKFTDFSLPASDFTVCLWWKIISRSTEEHDTLISIAVPAEDDQYSVRLRDSSTSPIMVIYAEGSNEIGTQSLNNLNILDWVYTCMVNSYSSHLPGDSTDLQIMVYHMDGEDSGWTETQLFSEVGITKKSVDGDAGVVLFQDQDYVGGGYEDYQATDGWRACMNIWSGTITADELLSFSDCEEKGDIFSMSEYVGEIGGAVNGYCVTPRIVGASDNELIRDVDSAYFCLIGAKFLTGPALTSVKLTSKLSCATMCTATDECYSANFYPATGSCDLFSREYSIKAEHLITSSDAVHISFLFCSC